ncbi:MAG TPA: ABC transporter substrate-binding protein, partial [Candidatus Limnocylindrales bacterium]|nr:ABC transporter substrate-binding protein [Candidatus Limnocylindrales bacterium]
DLRTGVTYHDGSTFDAESVKWNIDRYRTAEGSARSGELASIDSVVVVDASTVRFRLSAPFAGLLANLVDRAGMMVSRTAAEAGGEDFTRQAFRAGTGPFMLTEAVQDDHMTLEKNPNWWGRDADGNQLPYLDKITVRPITNSDVRLTNLRTGDAQVTNRIAGKDVGAVKTDGTLSYQEKPAAGFMSLIPNRAPGFVFQDARYVRAVSMAIARQEILDSVFAGFGVVGYGAIAPPHFAFDPSFRPYERPDPEGARRLVQEVGRGPLSFELLLFAGDPQTLQLAQLIQAQLARADITAELRPLGRAEVLQLGAERTFTGMTLSGWSGRIDPDGNTYDLLYTDRPFNDSSYSNAEVDRLLDEQRATTDEAERRSLLRAAEQIYVVDDPARVWFRFGISHVVTVKQVQGLEPYPDLLVRFHSAWLRD